MIRGLVNGALLALRAIQRNVLRATLTVLGILIAVMSVVAITALGAGARDSVAGKLQAIGSNFVVIFPQSTAVSGAHGAAGTGKRLTEEDGRALLREADAIVAITPWLQASIQVVNGDNNWQTMAGGATMSFQVVRDWRVAHGSVWTESDENTKSRVCLLGSTVATKLFGGADPVGATIRIGSHPFRVDGVLESKGDDPFGNDLDDIVMMPIGTMRSLILKTPPGFVGIFLASSRSADDSDRAVRQITSILRQRHAIAEGAQSDFDIHTLKEAQDVEHQIYGVLTLILVIIAGISLVVGGIGVMNIMLVSVTERTREIGIRMAIGAREADIRTQFLVEAVVLAVIGGALGALLGTAIVAVASKILEWKMNVDPVALFVSLAVSGITGITFGFFPARRASRLDPIVALHRE
jgi:putative ABC transport system permease protein